MTLANDYDVWQLQPSTTRWEQKPPTIASAATIAPTTYLSFISGTTAIATITPPADGWHTLCLIFTTTTPTAFTTTGNVKAVATPTTNIPMFMIYNPIEAKYYAGVLKAS